MAETTTEQRDELRRLLHYAHGSLTYWAIAFREESPAVLCRDSERVERMQRALRELISACEIPPLGEVDERWLRRNGRAKP